MTMRKTIYVVLALTLSSGCYKHTTIPPESVQFASAWCGADPAEQVRQFDFVYDARTEVLVHGRWWHFCAPEFADGFEQLAAEEGQLRLRRKDPSGGYIAMGLATGLITGLVVLTVWLSTWSGFANY